MSPGQVIAVVGPSGVGKDSVMAGLAAADPGLAPVRRTITRAAGLGDEAFDAVSAAEFDRRVAAGAFCLHWHAHGLCYGIPRDIPDRAAMGQAFLMNLSRTVLAEAHTLFTRFVVLRLSARPETLAARLTARGRETHSDIAARITHSGADIPAHIRVLDISNDGPLDQTVRTARAALDPERI